MATTFLFLCTFHLQKTEKKRSRWRNSEQMVMVKLWFYPPTNFAYQYHFVSCFSHFAMVIVTIWRPFHFHIDFSIDISHWIIIFLLYQRVMPAHTLHVINCNNNIMKNFISRACFQFLFLVTIMNGNFLSQKTRKTEWDLEIPKFESFMFQKSNFWGQLQFAYIRWQTVYFTFL